MNIKINRNLITLAAVIVSSFTIAATTNTFIKPAGILAGGFMGVAILIDMLAGLINQNLPASIVLVCLNLPVAYVCYKKISPRFTFFSLLQIGLTSLFLLIVPSYSVFNEGILNVVFGGFLYGIATTIALRGNASSGGTDFIALYVANKNGKEIWSYVFAFNAILLCFFGYVFGYEEAGYSILFQLVSTKTISTFHTRYKRMSLQIFTKKKDEVATAYVDNFHHGLTIIDGIGGYSKQPVSMITAIVSSYEVSDVIALLKETDPDIIINATKSENYVGRFYTAPIE